MPRFTHILKFEAVCALEHPNISMHILLTVPYTFPKVPTRRIFVTIKSLFSW